MRQKSGPPHLVVVPDIGLLSRVLCFIFADEVHEEEQVVCQVVLPLHMDFHPVGHFVQVVFADAADEAVVLQLVVDALQLVSQRAKRIDDET